MKRLNYIALLLILLIGCKDFTSTDPQQSDAYIKYFGDVGDTFGNDVEVLPDGNLLLLGYNEKVDTDPTTGEDVFTRTTILLQTDPYGNILSGWPQRFADFRGFSMAVDGAGYYIIGDSINESTNSTSMMLLITNTSGSETARIAVNSDSHPNAPANFNFHGTGIAISGTATALGYIEDGNSTNLFRVGFDLSTNTVDWFQLNTPGPQYLPGRSLVPSTGGGSLGHHWISTRTIGGQTKVVVQVGQEDHPTGNSDEVDGDAVGELTAVSGGYAGIGSNGGNVLFFLSDEAGNIVADNAAGSTITGTGLSVCQDQSGAIVALSAVPNANGGLDNDFKLLKVNSDASNVVFETNVGGSGDEQAGSVVESSNGGYIILGTSQLDGVRSMVLIKTNTEGTLTN